MSNQTRQATGHKRKLLADTTNRLSSKHHKKAAPFNNHTNDNYRLPPIATILSYPPLHKPSVLYPAPSARLGGNNTHFDIRSTLSQLSSIPRRTKEQRQSFNNDNSTRSMDADIQKSVRGSPSLPKVRCGRCGRPDLDFHGLQLHHQSSLYIDVKTLKVLYAAIVLRLPCEEIQPNLQNFDHATTGMIEPYSVDKAKIQAKIDECSYPEAWVRWFGILPKLGPTIALLDRFFAKSPFPPPYSEKRLKG